MRVFSPPMMSGSFSVVRVSDLHFEHIYLSNPISYDNFGQKALIKHAGSNNGTNFNMEVLMLFREKVYYEINWSKFSCKKKALDDAFVPMQVPSDAKLMGQAILGSSSSWGMGVLVNTWYGSLPENGENTFNWVIGNVDPMEYIPPSICPKLKADETEAPSNFFKVLKDFAQNVKDEESMQDY
uniref:Ependymin-like 1 n=1 Tax=Periophthalmus magnuspinnatus TaxID=409849 RepID=A0A3B3ZFP0_9GOBI